MQRVSLALAVLTGFVCDGSFLKLYSLEAQGLVSQPLLGFAEVQDLFLQQYFLLCPKFLHEAHMELLDAIVDSLRIVRCHYMEIFRALG